MSQRARPRAGLALWSRPAVLDDDGPGLLIAAGGEARARCGGAGTAGVEDY